MKIWPKSLLGQVLLTVALALLVAQSVSAILLWRAGESRRAHAALTAAAVSIIAPESSNTQRIFQPPPPRGTGISGGGAIQRDTGKRQRPFRRHGKRWRLEFTERSPLLPGEVRADALEAELRTILSGQGVASANIVIIMRDPALDPFVQSRPRLLRRFAARRNPVMRMMVAGVEQPGGNGWRVARVPMPAAAHGSLATIIFQTLVLYVVLISLLYLLLRRITRPLAALTTRTENFGQAGPETDALEPSGPADIHRLMAAHNRMETRIAGLLDEKDVMLGAIGHDLKTPLAALRVRIESVEDVCERRKMAASIADITQTLDDILTLARVGKADGPPEKTELSALLTSVVEEFEDRGKPVTIAGAHRAVRPVYITWLKRAVRNLISNAVRYGGGASVSLVSDTQAVVIRVEDNGPGIDPDQIEAMLEPFMRGETSRNRETGGAGLGLTLARAIAAQHGGTLSLVNRRNGGLRADIRLPLLQGQSG